MSERFDAIVIGVGQAAPALCARLDKEGLKTALIERKLLGGTCVNNGCVPTKTLVAGARAAHLASRGAEFGFAARAVRVDMRGVKRRKDQVVRQSTTGLKKWIAGMKHVSLVHGHARFISSRRIAVKGRELEAERIFINVGARAAIPELPGIEDVPFFTNSSMMGVDFLPRQLVIVGGSYIGLEFAQMYRRFGSQVTVVERAPKLLPREDDDVAAEIRAVLKREQIGIRIDAECMGRGAFTHTSYNDYEIVAANLFDNDKRQISDRIQAYALFIDPPLGRAGMTEAEARKSGKRVLIGKMSMKRVGRAREAGETQGFMKVLVDADSKELLGAAILGMSGDEVVHSLR